jgi:lysophospholipase L1-like esterase
MAPENPPRPPLARWKRFLFSAVLLLLTWGALEAIAYTYLRATRGYATHLYEFDFDPYRIIHPARNFVDTRGVRHNAQGFRRDSLVPLRKAPGAVRVFLMGGSTAYGTGGLWPHIDRSHPVLRNEETIDAYLQDELRRRFPGRPIEVINAGVTSTWTHHHLIYVNQAILRFDPDIILFLDGFNDFFFYDPRHDQFASYAYGEMATKVMGPPTLKSLASAVGWWLYRTDPLTHVALKSVRTFMAFRPPPPDRAPVQLDSAIAGLRETFPENAGKMHRRLALTLRDEGVTPVFLLQPILALESGAKPLTPVEVELRKFMLASWLPGYDEYLRRAVPYINEEESRMAAEFGAHYHDLTGIYAGVKEQVYTDYCHLTPLGNQLLARYVAERIAPLVQERIDGAPRDAAPGAAAGGRALSVR